MKIFRCLFLIFGVCLIFLICNLPSTAMPTSAGVIYNPVPGQADVTYTATLTSTEQIPPTPTLADVTYIATLTSTELIPPTPTLMVPIDPIEGRDYIRKDDPETIHLTLQRGQPEIVDIYKLELVFDNLNDQNQVEMGINFSEREIYDGMLDTSGDNGYYPNPGNYPGLESAYLLDYAQTLYRTHKTCTGILESEKWKDGKAIKDLSCGYRNFTGTSRFYEQCILDWSYDSYYEEYLDYGIVPFEIGETKNAYEFAIKLMETTGYTATVEISYIGIGRYEPIIPGSEVSMISPRMSLTTGTTTVMIVGNQFTDGMNVTFGGTLAQNVTLLNPNALFATTGAHAPGVVDVVVTWPDGHSAWLTNSFVYTDQIYTVYLPHTH